MGLQFEAMRYLVQQGCTWNPLFAGLAAAAASDVQALQWMREADQQPWSAATLSELLIFAGQFDSVAAAAWLREQGAQWPTSFLLSAALVIPTNLQHLVQDLPQPFAALLQHYLMTSGGEPVTVCWSPAAIQWALAHGCPWGELDSSACIAACSQLFTLHMPAAQQRLTWAHAAGCPCSCRVHRVLARLQHGRNPQPPAQQSTGQVEFSGWHAVLFEQYRPSRKRTALAVILLWTVSCFLVSGGSLLVSALYKRWAVRSNTEAVAMFERSRSIAVQFLRSVQQQRDLVGQQHLEWQLAHSRQFYATKPELLTDIIRAYLQNKWWPTTCVLPDMYYYLHETSNAILVNHL
jgi:hypothetical protein